MREEEFLHFSSQWPWPLIFITQILLLCLLLSSSMFPLN